ncbi:MAG: hypothetical protein NTY88_04510 [Bacteroidetes bacterium]|nr:hypothetical protein [Bacteroidota bacterium]
MKNITILLLLCLSACAASKKVESNPSKTLVVSFYSIGSGIDYKTKTEFDKYVEQFQNTEKKTLPVSKVQKGREGEYDYCIDLKPLSSTEQTKFIDGAKQLLNTGQWIRIAEKEKCNP